MNVNARFRFRFEGLFFVLVDSCFELMEIRVCSKEQHIKIDWLEIVSRA
jgi:hypothetical protein